MTNHFTNHSTVSRKPVSCALTLFDWLRAFSLIKHTDHTNRYVVISQYSQMLHFKLLRPLADRVACQRIMYPFKSPQCNDRGLAWLKMCMRVCAVCATVGECILHFLLSVCVCLCAGVCVCVVEVMCLFTWICECNRGCLQSCASIEVRVWVCVEWGPLFWQADQCSGCYVPISIFADEPGFSSQAHRRGDGQLV